jgi:hypothetical protein
MKQKFFDQFEIVRMTNKCLLVRDKKTFEEAFIHRNVFNSLDKAVDYRTVFLEGDSGRQGWIEVLVWKAF